jgi:hypothetical protein
MRISEPSFECPDTCGVLRQRGLSDVVDGQALAKYAHSTATASSTKSIYLRRELAAEVSYLHVNKWEQILRGGVVDEREKLEAARVEVWNGCDLAADMNLGNYFLFSVVADSAEVVPVRTSTNKLELFDEGKRTSAELPFRWLRRGTPSAERPLRRQRAGSRSSAC